MFKDDIKPDAVKIGMLHSAKVIKSVIHSLDIIKVKKIILDPVMIAKGGAKLIDDKAVELLKNELIKKVSLITPNIPEAEILTKTKIKTKEDMILAASILIELQPVIHMELDVHCRLLFLHSFHVENR